MAAIGGYSALIASPLHQRAELGRAHALVARICQAAANEPHIRLCLRRATRRWRHREHVIWRGPAAGLRINPEGSRPAYIFGTAEPDMQQLLASWLRPGAVFYDLGANVGFFSLIASRLVGTEGHVYAFEPSPATARALRANVDRNGLGNVTVIEAAVGREEGIARLDPVHGEAAQDAHVLPAGDNGGIEVRVVSIDTIVGDAVRPPDVVKIDVEGAEADVVLGMRATLASRRPSVVCEIHQTLHANEHPVETMLRDAGLALSWLEPGMSRDREWWAPHLVAVAAPSSAA